MAARVACALCVLLACGARAAASERAVVAGAVRFGALFAVHGAPAAARAGAPCGAVREHYGIQRVEATLLALDAINADARLLPRLRLGAELRDSCWAPPTALRQTIDLVRDAIAPPDVRHQQRASRAAYGGDDCNETQPWHAVSSPLMGVLGPGASSAAVQVQNLLQLFSIPQVSYSATSRELSDRARFSTFFRVVPSDKHQARLLVALLRAHNWTYVHALHTDESYGQSGMAAFREEAARGGVCVAREEALRAAPAPALVDAALARLAAGPRVAVCWCEGRTARALLAGLARARPPLRLRLLASDGWADRRDVVHGLEFAAHRALTLRIRSPYLKQFDAHYHALKPQNNSRNPWFQEFWEQKFNCSLDKNPENGARRCSGSESLAANYTQEPKLALIVRGVYALAHALHAHRLEACAAAGERADGLCDAMLPFNVSRYRQHLARVRFRAPDGGLVAFDDNGDPPPELSDYDVMSFERNSGGTWRYERVGRWRRGALHLRGGADAAYRRARGVLGACSAPCGAGQWARAGEGRARCCWTCETCAPLAIAMPPPHAGCQLCPPGHRPDIHRTTCLASPVEWGGGGRGPRAVSAVVGGAGLLAVLTCAVTFWRHRATPVVKSASRELCALLLCSAAMCHGAALAAAVRPAPAACALVRLAAPALGGVYAAVVARTVRVARLVAACERRPAARPRLLSSRAQVWMWLALSAPGAFVAVWSAVRWPAAPRIVHPGRARSMLVCGGELAPAQLAPLGPALVLLATCVVLAVRTRRLPHNFNETRFVGAAAYATCIIWVAFFPLYAVSAARTATLCACVSLSAGACVALSLGPRVWVCACRPARNTRAHFLTATSIRCHLGKYRPSRAPAAAARCDATCQTQAGAAPEAARCSDARRCSAVGACARVVRTSRADSADVLIVLLHHHHSLPPAPTDTSPDTQQETLHMPS